MSGNIETEVMIEIEGYENYYVTKDGNVWSERRKRYIEPNITNDNLVVSLCKNKVGKIFRVDHLVVKHWTEMKDENKNIFFDCSKIFLDRKALITILTFMNLG